MATDAHLRIGELSRRTGVSVELLRAWERRYGLLRPERSQGGFRLYSAGDEDRVRRMQEHMARGVSAAQAARLVLGDAQTVTASAAGAALDPEALIHSLRFALEGFDELAGQALLDDLLARFTLDTILRDIVMPYLHELGDRWECGEASVAQEHFASGLLRGRLLGLARDWGRGTGPHALLAGPPGERHDLGLIAFGLALRSRGWRVTFLGPDTPAADIAQAARSVDPDLIVVNATVRENISSVKVELRALTKLAPLAVGGAGADAALAKEVGARFLEGDPVTAAESIAAAPVR